MKKIILPVQRTVIVLMVPLLGFLASYTVSPLRPAHAACTAPSADFGSATQVVNIPSAASYKVWSRLMAPDATNNSYQLTIDNTCYTVGDSALQANAWTWVDYQDGNTGSKINPTLTAGQHTLKLVGREADVKLDRLLFVSDQSCTPTDTGNNCVTAVDATPPIVDITAPAANSTVTGTVNVMADAKDDGSLAKVEFYVNNSLKNTDTTAPYSYSWDTKAGNDGAYSLMAKAYDNSSNLAIDTVQVSVKNTDTQTPTAPASLTGTAAAYNKVNLSWKASTDNIGVAQYRVIRDGVALAQGIPGTTYSDITTLPNKTYTYQVVAIDAAGNVSPLSNSAQVTTPTVPDTQAPTAPSNLTGVVVSPTQVNIAWGISTDNIAVAKYEVYRATSTGSASKVATVTTTSFGDSSLTQATAYTYYVIAKDAAGNTSPQSNNLKLTTQNQPQPPQSKGGLHGRVTNNKRKPVANAQVIVRVDGVKQIYTTDNSGNYSITNLPVGKYNVKFRGNSYRSQTVSVTVKNGISTTKNVRLQPR